MGNKKKIAFGILIVVLIAVYVGAKAYANNVAEKKVNKAIGKVAYFVDVDYKKVSVDLWGLATHIKGVTISPVGEKETVNIDDIVIYDIDDENSIPLFLHIVFKGINLNVESFRNNTKKLKDLGYDNIKANMELDYKYDVNEKEFFLNTLSNGAEKIGNINLKFHISNIDLSPENIVSILFTFPQILIHSAELSYKDDSLISRVLKIAAKKEDKDVDSIISKIIQDIDNEISSEKDQFTKEAMEAFKKFIKDPNKISISISPKKPVPLGRLQRVDNPKEIIKLLNVKISTW